MHENTSTGGFSGHTMLKCLRTCSKSLFFTSNSTVPKIEEWILWAHNAQVSMDVQLVYAHKSNPSTAPRKRVENAAVGRGL